jgi:hypothetical protein
MSFSECLVAQLCKQTLWRFWMRHPFYLAPCFGRRNSSCKSRCYYRGLTLSLLARLNDGARGYGTGGQNRERVIPTSVG